MKTRILGAAAVATLVAAGCSDERAITYEPVGDVAYGANMIKAATNLPRGRVNFTASSEAGENAAADTVVVRFAGLDSLTTGSYAIWAANDSATKFALMTGMLIRTTIDTSLNDQGDPVFTTTVDTLNNVSSFTTGGPNKSYVFRALRSDMAGLAASDSLDVVLFSIESGTPGTTPDAARRPLWGRRSQASSNLAGLRFGNFAPQITEEYAYAVSTTAAVPTATTPSLPRGRVEVRGAIYTVNDSNYFRPPVGYYYHAWAVKVDEFGQPIDTVSLGEKRSPFPRLLSFFTADTENPDPISMYAGASIPCNVGTGSTFICPNREPVIVASQHRVSADTVPGTTANDAKRWRGFAFTYVTLENKANPEGTMGGVILMGLNNPGSISGF